MTECDNAEIRDVLPDFVAETLSAAEQCIVENHVVRCVACIDEVALLRAMRAATPVAPVIDVARIVRALPQRHPALRIVAGNPTALSVRSRRPFAGVWRAAAAIGVTVIGGWSVLSYQRDQSANTGDAGATRVAAGVPVRDSQRTETILTGTPSGTLAIADTPRAAATSTSMARTGTREAALSLGDLSDYSDDDLQRMLDRLDKWDGATSAEPVPTVPIIPVTERGT